MSGRRRWGATIAGIFGAVAVLVSVPIDAASASPVTGLAQQNAAGGHHHAVCGGAPGGRARCYAEVVDRGATDPQPLVSGAPYGLDPATIKSVYGFPTGVTAGAGTTIAIVDAYDDPAVQADLNMFATTYSLPCNGCLTKVNQAGGTTYPASDPGWLMEISLDVQWVHAIAPGAHLLLVEANSSSYADLMQAEDYAAAHASYVSNSWGNQEFAGETTFDSHFLASGVSFFVSAGDAGLPAEYPSSSPNVISVGGTSLANIGTPNFSETAWSMGGGGCSSQETATSAQQGLSTYGQVGCNGMRATPDVALDGDPASGVSVYSTPASGSPGWIKLGGTSASAPMWAARSAVAGGVMDSTRIYGAASPPFRDITAGNNGAPALTGFDLASGRGSWADPSPAVLTTPTNGAANVATAATFSWSSASGGGLQAYYLMVGNSPGTSDVATSGVLPLSTTSSALTLPAGRTLFARIYTDRNGLWNEYSQISFTTAGAASPAALTAPLTGAVNVPTGVTISWSSASGGGLQAYYLMVGSSPGANDVATSGVLPLSTTSFAFTLPPARTLFARIYTHRNGLWNEYSQISFTTAGVAAPAVLTAPTNGAVNVPTGTTFSWSSASGGGLQAYYLMVGSSPGANDVATSGVLSLSTSSFALTLPAGRTLFARIYTDRNGLWNEYSQISFMTQ